MAKLRSLNLANKRPSAPLDLSPLTLVPRGITQCLASRAQQAYAAGIADVCAIQMGRACCGSSGYFISTVDAVHQTEALALQVSNRVSDPRALDGMPSLQDVLLHVERAMVSEGTLLRSLPKNGTSLWIDDSTSEDEGWHALATLSRLSQFRFHGSVRAVPGAYLPVRLRHLQLVLDGEGSLQALTRLRHLTNLSIRIDDRWMPELSPLAELQALRHLELSIAYPLRLVSPLDLSFLLHLVALESLVIRGNLKSLPVSGLTRLKSLAVTAYDWSEFQELNALTRRGPFMGYRSQGSHVLGAQA